MIEKWKDIPGWEGIYQISSHGRLKSFKKYQSGRILKNTNKRGGYLSVVLCKKGRDDRYCRIHRLVAEAFLTRLPGKTQVNHKDCNPQNNHVENLEWVTPSENIRHAIRKKPEMVAGMVRYNQFLRPKPVVQKAMSGKVLGIYPNIQEAARATGVCGRNIHQVASKTEYKPGLIRKQAGGYKWSFREVQSVEYKSHRIEQHRELLQGL